MAEIVLISFMSLWHRAWYWMDKKGIQLEPWQAERAATFTPDPDEDEPSDNAMRHTITLHFERVRPEQRPERFRRLVTDHMVEMMNQWGWPEWGFKEVKHLKPEKTNG